MSQAILLPPGANTVYVPRLRIKAGGIALPSPVEASVTQTNTWEASRFSAGIALRDTDAMNAIWWSDQVDVRVEISFSVDGAVNFTPVISGVVDAVEIDYAGNYLTINGRDLAALLIDQKTSNSYTNMTASEVAAALAASVGLGTTHIVATTVPVGEFYASDHVRLDGGDLSRAITKWDLLIYLAQHEGFDLFVLGSDLYFQPAAVSTAIPFQVNVGRNASGAYANVENLTMRRDLTLAKDVNVTVKSINSAAGNVFTATATGPAVGASLGETQHYVFYQPNLTLAQAQNLANQKLAEISRHERVIRFDCAGELNLTPFGVVRLSGTGTSFDQLYYPDQIVRTMSFSGSFRQHVVAKNHTASEQVALASGGTGASGLDYLTGGQ